jgi:hypothetical protein
LHPLHRTPIDRHLGCFSETRANNYLCCHSLHTRTGSFLFHQCLPPDFSCARCWARTNPLSCRYANEVLRFLLGPDAGVDAASPHPHLFKVLPFRCGSPLSLSSEAPPLPVDEASAWRLAWLPPSQVPRVRGSDHRGAWICVGVDAGGLLVQRVVVIPLRLLA